MRPPQAPKEKYEHGSNTNRQDDALYMTDPVLSRRALLCVRVVCHDSSSAAFEVRQYCPHRYVMSRCVVVPDVRLIGARDGLSQAQEESNSFAFRDTSLHLPLSMYASARNPSHFSSKIQSGWLNGPGARPRGMGWRSGTHTV